MGRVVTCVDMGGIVDATGVEMGKMGEVGREVTVGVEGKGVWEADRGAMEEGAGCFGAGVSDVEVRFLGFRTRSRVGCKELREEGRGKGS